MTCVYEYSNTTWQYSHTGICDNHFLSTGDQQHLGTDCLPVRPLTRQDLLYIARVICDWKEFACHLGLEEADIATIEQNHVSDYEEQKIQMLLKWYQQSHSPPSCQSLVRIIEDKMQNHKLAQVIKQILRD